MDNIAPIFCKNAPWPFKIALKSSAIVKTLDEVNKMRYFEAEENKRLGEEFMQCIKLYSSTEYTIVFVHAERLRDVT